MSGDTIESIMEQGRENNRRGLVGNPHQRRTWQWYAYHAGEWLSEAEMAKSREWRIVMPLPDPVKAVRTGAVECGGES